MENRGRSPGRNQEPQDAERAGARHAQGERDNRHAAESPGDMLGGNRFRGEEDGGDRGYRGQAGADTPPGSVPGGSYGGGGGYQRGGYDRGNYDPGVGMARGRQGRGGSGPSRSGGGEGGGRAPHDEPRPYGGVGEYRSPAGGDWRQGYGTYGMSERGGAVEGGGLNAGEDMFGGGTADQQDGYGFGEGGHGLGQGGGTASRSGDEESMHWGEQGRPNRGSQGPGWRGEQRWPEGVGGGHGGREAEWPHLEPWAVPGPFSGRGPEGYRRSEEAIRTDVCERLTRHGQLDASRIRVQVEHGEVILEGHVDSRTAKRMAEDTAESVMGVRDVQNRLRIDDQYRD
jgi:hypothetical protein